MLKVSLKRSEPNSDMTHILELSAQEFKINLINTLRGLMEKVDNMQGQINNVSREMKSVRKNQYKC